MKMKLYLPFLLIVAHVNFSFAQEWAKKMQDPQANFFEIKADFEQYWLTHDKTEKGVGYKAFKRWENFVERRVYPSGDLAQLNLTSKNFETFLKQQNTHSSSNKIIGGNSNLIASSTFTPMGPFGAINGNAGGQLLKSGRIGFITVNPTNTLNLWVGTPAGGLWKTTNGGTNWTTNTDNLGVLGCSDLAIDPSNNNNLYLATGDGDAGDTRSIGVLKSTDGGLTWAVTGLTSPVTNNFLIRRLIINPVNPQIVLAATNVGVYRTINAGANWTQVTTFSCYDLEFMPGNPNTVYAAGTSFYISTNAGLGFTQVTTGISTAAQRMSIAVTPADVNYVYVLASNSSSGFLGLYQSTNAGTSFSVMSTTPNILDGSTTGSGTGGQGWYDLCIAASPLNKNEIVTGGVNVWQSLNGGSSWALYGHWTGSGGAPFTHADQHDLEYAPNGVLFNTNDGTVYQRSVGATTWTEISGAINISQMYRIGLSSLTPNKWITGHQDNGSSIWNGTSYNACLGGDGMDCFFDRSNDNNVFGEYQNGSLQRSVNGGLSWTGATSGLSGAPPWVTVWKQDPQNPNNLYVGYTDLFKSTNQAVSWTSLAAIPGTGTIREFAISPNNNLVIYVLKSSGIYKTIDGGLNWTNVTGTVPVASALPEFVCIDPTDANNAWVVCSGYSNGNKVFMTTNGGSTWTNYSGNLPNLPANCCIYQASTNDRIYIGMDVGIYYRDNLSASWTMYNTGLPNVPISDFEISPATPSLLHVATYGRGVWVASLAAGATIPTSSFSINPGILCANSAITFSDQSINTPTSWNWSVSPATASISSTGSQNPAITFLSSGTYTVSFVASNSNGSGNTYIQILTVNTAPNLSLSALTQTVCGGSAVSFTASGANSYAWSNGGGSASTATFAPSVSTIYTVVGISNGCTVSKSFTVTASPVPTITVNGVNNICIGNSAVLLANGALSYTWNNGSLSPFISVSPSVTTSYTVNAIAPNFCKSSFVKTITVDPLPVITISQSDSVLCIDQAVLLNAGGASSYTWLPGGQNNNPLLLNLSASSTFTCLGIDVNGCSNSSVATISISLCTSLHKSLSLNQDQFMVFPNPTKGKLSLKSESALQKQVLVSVLDVSGKVVFNQQLNFTSGDLAQELNISQLAAGMYFLKLSNKESSSGLVRIIKE